MQNQQLPTIHGASEALRTGRTTSRALVDACLARIEQFEERVHAWSLPEVTAMITKAGLVVEDVTDGTCRNAFDPERSNRIITWARKKQ